jgi:hypothetical protein
MVSRTVHTTCSDTRKETTKETLGEVLKPKHAVLPIEMEAVQSFRRTVVELLSRRPGFDARSVHVGSVLDEVAVGQFYLRGPRFYLIDIIQLMLHNHISLTYYRS